MARHSWDNSHLPSMSNGWNNGDSLGTKIETMFLRFVQRAFLWGVEFISDRLVDIFDNMMKIMRPGVAKATDPIIQEFLKDDTLPSYIRNAFQTALTEEGESSWLIKIMIFWQTITMTVTGSMSPFRRIVEYRADNQVRSFLPSPLELSTLLNVGLINPDKYREVMARLGVAEPLIPVYQEYARNLPNMGELMAGKWRGVISEADFEAAVKRQGHNDTDVKLYRELLNNLPNIQDIIRMMVREAFNDETSHKFSYDEDYPKEINQYFIKNGYNEDWGKRFWRAHWTLPSPTQAYEMLHRGLITVEELETLLKTADYPKFWRDKLMAVSFNVFTRVDLRRLLQAGLIDEARAMKEYMAQGYDEERAKILTEFAVKGISNNEKDLTKSEILNLYEEGLTDRGSTAELLIKMGYDSEEAEDILKLSDVAIAKSMRTDLINFAKEKFLAKKTNESQARSELAEIGLKQQSVDRYVMNWVRSTEIDTAIPSMADIKRWYLADYIDETKLRSFLNEHKHTKENIELYVKEMNDKKTEKENEQA